MHAERLYYTAWRSIISASNRSKKSEDKHKLANRHNKREKPKATPPVLLDAQHITYFERALAPNLWIKQHRSQPILRERWAGLFWEDFTGFGFWSYWGFWLAYRRLYDERLRFSLQLHCLPSINNYQRNPKFRIIDTEHIVNQTDAST